VLQPLSKMTVQFHMLSLLYTNLVFLVLRVISAQWKPVYYTADSRSVKFTSTFNHESRYAYSRSI
jgi:hypothetical protein